jgi:hypothetical protein
MPRCRGPSASSGSAFWRVPAALLQPGAASRCVCSEIARANDRLSSLTSLACRFDALIAELEAVVAAPSDAEQEEPKQPQPAAAFRKQTDPEWAGGDSPQTGTEAQAARSAERTRPKKRLRLQRADKDSSSEGEQNVESAHTTNHRPRKQEHLESMVSFPT